MIRVPKYKRDVSARGAYSTDVHVQADASHFGAGVGSGLQSMAQGMGQLGAALTERQKLEDMTQAREAEVDYASFVQERLYGENGYLQLQGKDAIDARPQFEADTKTMREEIGNRLSKSARSYYLQSSGERFLDANKQAILHSGKAMKEQVLSSFQKQIDFHAQEATLYSGDINAVDARIAMGQKSIAERGALTGQDQQTIANEQKRYAGDIYMGMAYQQAEEDPIGAQAWVESLGERLDVQQRRQFDRQIAPKVFNAKVQNASDTIMNALPAPDYTLPHADNDPMVTGAVAARPSQRPIDYQTLLVNHMGMTAIDPSSAPASFIRHAAGETVDPAVAPWATNVTQTVLGEAEIDAHGINKNAKAFLNFALPADEPTVGDIVIAGQNGQPSSLGFYQGMDEAGNMLIYGKAKDGAVVSVTLPLRLSSLLS